MFTNSPPQKPSSFTSTWNTTRAPQLHGTIPRERRSPIGGRRERHPDALRFHSSHEHAPAPGRPMVDIRPSEAASRQRVSWRGMTAELVTAVTHDRIECRFNAPQHLLAVYERGLRHEGETFVQGAPPSSLRDFSGKLTFVPAGHEYREWQEPRIRPRVLYVFFDVGELRRHSGVETSDLVPRVFFENSTLWDTAAKLSTLIGNSTPDDRSYIEAVGVLLAHEVARIGLAKCQVQPQVRGGLASWQKRVVASYIEDHLAEHVPLAALARLVRLSTFHFCRAFKQSFGVPPHQYHMMQRIKRAKMLLAKPSPSITDIALDLGFSQTSSFSGTFRKATGQTPTAYYKGL
jgi:AraC family transcriptional regulator